MKQIIENNYDVTVKRGCINTETTIHEFLYKLYEEVHELHDEIELGNTINHELSDVILVCLNLAKHFNIDIESEIIKVIDINKSRI